MRAKSLAVIASFGAVAILAALGGGLWVTEDTSTSKAVSNRILIVKDSDEPLPFSGSTLDAHGAKVFSSWPEAAAAADETTKAVIVTALALPRVDAAWIRERAHGGMVVGGLNVRAEVLAETLGLNGEVPKPEGAQVPPPPVLDSSRFLDGPFFSLALDVRSGGHIRRGGMVEKFASGDQFFAHVERYIASAAAMK